MELQITSKNMELSPTICDYIERKFNKLGRHLPHITDCKVEIFEEKTKSPQQRFGVQATLEHNGTLLRGEERGQDLFAAIDRAATVMKRRIEHYKGKLYDKGRGSSLARGISDKRLGITPKEIVKQKRFPVKSMSLDEAIDQMELLGHDFFLFLNDEDAGLNLLYRRRDGNYGLIEPTSK